MLRAAVMFYQIMRLSLTRALSTLCPLCPLSHQPILWQWSRQEGKREKDEGVRQTRLSSDRYDTG